jgi:DNA-binding LytR/AlgR family response regulator
MHIPTAVIAEDESLLAENLHHELAKLWPELSVVAQAQHGAAAVDAALAHRPDICFLDIRMPGMTGLEVAAALADEWPDDQPFPLLVFVTAYEQYALHAFEHAALDYLVKPLQTERLAQTCLRLKAALALRMREKAANHGEQYDMQAVVEQLRLVLGDAAMQPTQKGGRVPVPLKLLKVAVGNSVLMVPVDEVIYFEAADKYVRVLVPDKEYLIRISLRELLQQLDQHRFWQIHRGIIVRSDAIERAEKDEFGKTFLHLRGSKDTLQVGRMYVHLFRVH